MPARRDLAPFAEVPVNRFLGYRLVEQGDDRARVQMPVRPEYAQENGVVQGGILTALADTAAAYALLPAQTADSAMSGIGLQMSFLESATTSGAPLEAIATVLRAGRTIAVVESEVRQGERLIARGTVTFLCYRPEPA